MARDSKWRVALPVLSVGRARTWCRCRRGTDPATGVGDRLRIAELRQGERADATMVVRTRRAVLERVVTLFGVTLAIGAAEVAVGLAGIVGGALVVAKFGFDGLVSTLKGFASKLVTAVQQLLSDVAQLSSRPPVPTSGEKPLYLFLTSVRQEPHSAVSVVVP